MLYKKLLTIILLSGLALTGCSGSGGSEEVEVATVDSDNDGVVDADDAFPNDSSETKDSDDDGIGDNADVFPDDATETKDTDEDGVGDNADEFPNDATETTDTDGDGYGDNSDYAPENKDIWLESQVKYTGACTPTNSDVNFTALLAEDCNYLSAYNLFADMTNPTQAANGIKSLPYDLSTPLFTDYATKYRFVIMPDGEAAQYNVNEALEFPVGTVLVKTFALPQDTGSRGFENETLIETRLLIHRSEGWVALPYYWSADGSDAKLAKYGKQVANASVTHLGETYDFTYVVPTENDCRQCHQITAGVDGDDNASQITPIGPKARLLNYEFSYSAETKNQLQHWIDKSMLAGAPEDLGTIDSVSNFKDEDITDALSLDSESLTKVVKGYFDINCAHCHRPEGSASNTGLHLEYWRDFLEQQTKHGICKQPIAYGGEGLGYDIEPGVAVESIVWARMNSNEAKVRMPEIGRSLIHQEGVRLVEEWIGRLNAAPYNLSSCTAD